MMNAIKQILLLSLMFVCMAACVRSIADFEEIELKLADDVPNVPEAEYREVAWLDNDLLVFSYRKPEFGNALGDYRIGYTQLNSEIWQDISLLEPPEQCAVEAGLLKNLQRLPNCQLGYTYDCLGDGISGILYSWNQELNKIKQIHYYDPPFRVGTFSFESDMTEYLQVNENGLSQELYRVKLGNDEPDTKVQRFLPNFKRIREPAWSPDGKTIAFLGNETVDESNNWQELTLRPWDLYLMDADGSNVRMLFSQIGNPLICVGHLMGSGSSLAGVVSPLV